MPSRPLLLATLLACSSASSPSSSPHLDASTHADAPHSAPDASDARPRDAATHDAPAGPPLVTQAGYFDLPAQATAAKYPARMFWSFRPADTSPNDRPLLVLFDGGPGGATTANLLPYGTGPMTLDPDGGAPVANAASFTRFANLLYLDERQSGLSYGLGDASPANVNARCTFSILDDAADFIRAIAAFLEGHGSLSQSKVVLVGESYGGTRTTAILHLAASHADASVTMPSDVRQFLGAHAAQLGEAVLIEPLVAGAVQFLAQQQLTATDPYLAAFNSPAENSDAGCVDSYDVQHPCGWSDGLAANAAAALASADASTALLGVDLATIPDLLPAARTSAFRTTTGTADPSAAAFVSRFGALGPEDAYWSGVECACSGYIPTQDGTAASWFIPVLLTSRLFITNARYDAVIYSPAIPYILQHDAQLATTIDTTPQAGVARPGWIHVTLPTDAGTSHVEIRFPSYTSSGHMVAVSQGADLADDVEAWLASLP